MENVKLTPSIKFISQPYVLIQAWKLTAALIMVPVLSVQMNESEQGCSGHFKKPTQSNLNVFRPSWSDFKHVQSFHFLYSDEVNYQVPVPF